MNIDILFVSIVAIAVGTVVRLILACRVLNLRIESDAASYKELGIRASFKKLSIFESYNPNLLNIIYGRFLNSSFNMSRVISKNA